MLGVVSGRVRFGGTLGGSHAAVVLHRVAAVASQAALGAAALQLVLGHHDQALGGLGGRAVAVAPRVHGVVMRGGALPVGVLLLRVVLMFCVALSASPAVASTVTL